MFYVIELCSKLVIKSGPMYLSCSNLAIWTFFDIFEHGYKYRVKAKVIGKKNY